MEATSCCHLGVGPRSEIVLENTTVSMANERGKKRIRIGNLVRHCCLRRKRSELALKIPALWKIFQRLHTQETPGAASATFEVHHDGHPLRNGAAKCRSDYNTWQLLWRWGFASCRAPTGLAPKVQQCNLFDFDANPATDYSCCPLNGNLRWDTPASCTP